MFEFSVEMTEIDLKVLKLCNFSFCFAKLESSQLSAKYSKIRVQGSNWYFNSIQTRGMYITFVNFVKNFVTKEYLESKENVHNMLESGLTYVVLALEWLES